MEFRGSRLKSPPMHPARHLLVNLGKTGFSWLSWFFGRIWLLRGFWQDRSVRENGAQLYWPRVSNFLSHRIVKSVTFRISGKLEFQCTRNGTQNPPFCPGSPQNTFIIFFDLSRPDLCFKLVFQLSEVSNSGNLNIGKPRFTNKCPAFL